MILHNLISIIMSLFVFIKRSKSNNDLTVLSCLNSFSNEVLVHTNTISFSSYLRPNSIVDTISILNWKLHLICNETLVDNLLQQNSSCLNCIQFHLIVLNLIQFYYIHIRRIIKLLHIHHSVI